MVDLDMTKVGVLAACQAVHMETRGSAEGTLSDSEFARYVNYLWTTLSNWSPSKLKYDECVRKLVGFDEHLRHLRDGLQALRVDLDLARVHRRLVLHGVDDDRGRYANNGAHDLGRRHHHTHARGAGERYFHLCR